MTTQPGDPATTAYGAACPRCGSAVAAEDWYCGRCGTPLNAAAAAWAPPVAPPPPAGAMTSYGARLADWWPRVGAMLIDGLVLIVPTIAIDAAIVGIWGPSDGPGIPAIEFVIGLVVGGTYFGQLNGRGNGQTLGNRAASIAVRDVSTGEVIGLGRGLLRWFVRLALYMFLALPGLLNDLWPLWDKQRQTIADKAARSVMIRLR